MTTSIANPIDVLIIIGLLHFWDKQISHKFFTFATADVACTASRPWATGMKETTVGHTHASVGSVPDKRPLCSASELKN